MTLASGPSNLHLFYKVRKTDKMNYKNPSVSKILISMHWYLASLKTQMVLFVKTKFWHAEGIFNVCWMNTWTNIYMPLLKPGIKFPSFFFHLTNFPSLKLGRKRCRLERKMVFHTTSFNYINWNKMLNLSVA